MSRTHAAIVVLLLAGLATSVAAEESGRLVFYVGGNDCEPLADVKLSYYVERGDEPKFAETDEAGEAIIPFDPAKRLTVECEKKGWMDAAKHFDVAGVPPRLRMCLAEAVTIRGRVIDHWTGRPIEGAELKLGPRGFQFLTDGQRASWTKQRIVPLDERGFWELPYAGSRPSDSTTYVLSIPVGDQMVTLPMRHLRSDEMKQRVDLYRVPRRFERTVRVVDAAGEPLSGVIVKSGVRSSVEYRTNDRGEVTVPYVEGLPLSTTVMAREYGPVYESIESAKKLDDRVFTLHKTARLTIRLVDQNLDPIADGAIVASNEETDFYLKGAYNSPTYHDPEDGPITLESFQSTDENGVWSISPMPVQPVRLYCAGPGGHETITLDLDPETASKPITRTVTITLPPQIRLTGRFLDATTGEPITTGKFYRMRSFDGETYTRERGLDGSIAADGSFSVSAPFHGAPVAFGLLLEGYPTDVFHIADGPGNKNLVTVKLTPR